MYLAILTIKALGLIELFGQYAGSAFGTKGIENRVRKNHQRFSYRIANPKLLYTAMDTPNVTTDFCLLIKFPRKVHIGMVLLAEAACANIFGAWQTAEHMRIRVDTLPRIPARLGLNRADPLVGSYHVSKARATNAQQELLVKAQESGDFKVYCNYSTGDKKYVHWRMYLSAFCFTIPIKIANAWKLESGGRSHVTFEVLDQVHMFHWA